MARKPVDPITGGFVWIMIAVVGMALYILYATAGVGLHRMLH
jgi:hypothetical protein